MDLCPLRIHQAEADGGDAGVDALDAHGRSLRVRILNQYTKFSGDAQPKKSPPLAEGPFPYLIFTATGRT